MSTDDPRNTAPEEDDIYRRAAREELAAIHEQAEAAMDPLQGDIGDGVVLAQLQRLLPIPGFPVGPEALSNLDEATVGTIVADIKTAVEKALDDELIQSQLARLGEEQAETTEVADGETASAISQSRAVNEEQKALYALVHNQPIGALTKEVVERADPAFVGALSASVKASLIRTLSEMHAKKEAAKQAVPESFTRMHCIHAQSAIAGFCEHESRFSPTMDQVLAMTPEQYYVISTKLAEALSQYVKTDGAKFLEVIHSDSDAGGGSATETRTELQRQMSANQTEKRVGLAELLDLFKIEGISKDEVFHLPPEFVAQFCDIGLSVIIDACKETGVPIEHKQPIMEAQARVMMQRSAETHPQREQAELLDPEVRRLMLQLPPNTVKIYTDPSALRSKADVIGLDEQWKQMEPMLYRLMYPGAIRTRAEHTLMVGYYGVGKSLTAEAMAREILEQRIKSPDLPQIAFLKVNLSNVFYKWVGESNTNVNRVIDLMRACAPCIAFCDELEAAMSDSSNTQMHEETLRSQSTFMQELDGMDPMTGVAVIGATNRPDVINQGLLRGSRFGKAVHFPMPDGAQLFRMLQKKSEILQVPVNAPELQMRTIMNNHAHGKASLEDAYTGADIEQLIRILDEDHLRRIVEGDQQRPIDQAVFSRCHQQFIKERQIRRAVTQGRLAEYIMHTPACPATSAMRAVSDEHTAPEEIT